MSEVLLHKDMLPNFDIHMLFTQPVASNPQLVFNIQAIITSKWI